LNNAIFFYITIEKMHDAGPSPRPGMNLSRVAQIEEQVMAPSEAADDVGTMQNPKIGRSVEEDSLLMKHIVTVM
jgi:hypothetical protein